MRRHTENGRHFVKNYNDCSGSKKRFERELKLKYLEKCWRPVTTLRFPQGARPDLTVDGTIELERLIDVLFIGMPVHGGADRTIKLFKIIDDKRAAVRVPVKLGRSSVGTIEITQGLKIGDQVILSDMSEWEEYERIRIQ